MIFGTFATLAAASTLNLFCIIIKRRKSHLPDLPRNCFVLRYFSFLSDTRKLANCSLRFVHQRCLLCFIFSPFSSSSFSTSFLCAFSDPATFQLVLLGFSDPFSGCLCGRYSRSHLSCFLPKFLGPHPGCFFHGFLGPFPVCFLQRFLGPFPVCFFFFFEIRHQFSPNHHPLPHP